MTKPADSALLARYIAESRRGGRSARQWSVDAGGVTERRPGSTVGDSGSASLPRCFLREMTRLAPGWNVGIASPQECRSRSKPWRAASSNAFRKEGKARSLWR